ncbi:hypothetical protein [Alicyclobacillus sacchari]|uniref:hypothetical protein n=1 Tax=Alicyclobacillus sacchari TaxID=392010 RepID=UPI0024E18596|nr:hypothetical protein [Alicyclobacillus sacchari]
MAEPVGGRLYHPGNPGCRAAAGAVGVYARAAAMVLVAIAAAMSMAIASAGGALEQCRRARSLDQSWKCLSTRCQSWPQTMFVPRAIRAWRGDPAPKRAFHR